jgi:hypothetical protein
MLTVGLFSLRIAAVVAADVHSRSSQLGTVLTTLESEIAACAVSDQNPDPSHDVFCVPY